MMISHLDCDCNSCQNVKFRGHVQPNFRLRFPTEISSDSSHITSIFKMFFRSPSKDFACFSYQNLSTNKAEMHIKKLGVFPSKSSHLDSENSLSHTLNRHQEKKMPTSLELLAGCRHDARVTILPTPNKHIIRGNP